MSKWEDNEEIQIFREYLRLPTMQPDVDYEPCMEFLKRQANNLGLPFKIYYPGGPEKPILVMTWTGTQPELPSIVLNSHTDVVPANDEEWTHPPFAAEIDDEGRIFARGSQDMKSNAMQYLAAIRALKKEGITLNRTVHVFFVPDEEIGGKLGMGVFVDTPEFQSLNVGFALDESSAGPSEEYYVYYGERSAWHMNIKIGGTGGHASIPFLNTAAPKLRFLLDKFMDLREAEQKKLFSSKGFLWGSITSVNLTKIHGGNQNNVIPTEINVVFDIRVSIEQDHAELLSKIEQWCREAGDEIEISFDLKEPRVEPTKIDATNPYWVAFKSATDELGLKYTPNVCPGGTDSRYLRNKGIPVIGFSPMNKTPLLLHCIDEFITADTYFEGIEIYKKLLLKIGNA